ncbi:hypothetical protein PsAD46_03771 [Pseudovibrio sp. Ad46]|nr:hypothetical protein PsAD46_03771 [Pseudovibrio sp. Ad46]KZK96812.1 hypothetical protein PsAD5_02407 [Pseudovibrio sp. Ad5]
MIAALSHLRADYSGKRILCTAPYTLPDEEHRHKKNKEPKPNIILLLTFTLSCFQQSHRLNNIRTVNKRKKRSVWKIEKTACTKPLQSLEDPSQAAT